MAGDTGFGLWLTGLPASGKTTLARGIAAVLLERAVGVQVLDSDDLRDVLTPQPAYTFEERDWFYHVVAYIGRLLTGNGVNVIFASTAHRRQYREWARRGIDPFLEIYVQCPLEVCMERDRKGIYEKGLAGEADTVPGLQVLYEPPEAPDLTVDTEGQPPEEGVLQVVERLETLGLVPAACD